VIETERLDLEKWIIIKSNKTICIEEEQEIIDLAKQVLTRNDERRKVYLLEDIDFIAKEI